MYKKIILLFFVVALAINSAGSIVNSAYAQGAATDVFAVIKIVSPGEYITNAAQYLDKIQPGLGAMINTMMVGQMLFKNPTWTGMDLLGEYTAVVLNPLKYSASPFALVFPLTNKDEFLKVFSQSVQPAKETLGLATFIQPSDRQKVYLAFPGNLAILSSNPDVTIQVKTLVEQKSLVLAEIPGKTGQLEVFIPIDRIFETFSPMIDMLKQQLFGFMSVFAAQGSQNQAQAQAAMNVLKAEIDLLLSLLQQTQKLYLKAAFTSEGIRIGQTIFAKDTSNMAKFFAAQSPGKSSLLGLIPADAGIVAGGSINFTPEFIEGYLAFLKMVSQATPGTDAATVDKLAQWINELFEVFGDEFASGGLGLSQDTLMMQIYTVTDAAKAKQLFEQYPEMMKTMAAMQKNVGADLDIRLLGKTEYNGGEIYDYVFNVKTVVGSSLKLEPTKSQAILQTVFGENNKMSVGFVGNHGVLGFGKNSQAQVQKIMDRLKAGEEVTAQCTPSVFGFAEEYNFFMCLSVPKIVAWFLSQQQPEAPKVNIQESRGIGVTTRFVDASLEGELFLPVEEVLAIRNFSGQMIQVPQGMPESGPQTPQPQPTVPPTQPEKPQEIQPEKPQEQPEEDIEPPAF